MKKKEQTVFRSGYVAILGKPNSGKSTLLNAIVGQKIAIVSDKPQTTRDRIAGIFTTTDFQIVFVDTPGVIVPQDRFNEALVGRAADALQGADVVYHLVDAIDREPGNERLSELLGRIRGCTRFLVVNKIDRLPARVTPRPPAPIDPTRYDGVFYVSALRRRGIDKLIDSTVECLQPGPMYYDPEQLSDRDERFLAAETVREKVFLHTGQEIPYAVYTEVDSFEERPDKDFIRVNIFVERDTQKAIIIGADGRTLKRIGTEARHEIERLTGRPAFLELWVKVRRNWRKSEFDLNNFGFKLPGKRRKKSG
jgi:GTP-binding protein Era